LWQSSRLGLFWASNPKIDQSPQMGFEVPGSQSNKQTRWPKNHPQWHFISIGLCEEEALKQWKWVKMWVKMWVRCVMLG
jgi:hypothetical protein